MPIQKALELKKCVLPFVNHHDQLFIHAPFFHESMAFEELEQERHARAAAEASWRQECDATLQLREQYGKLQQQLRHAERHWVIYVRETYGVNSG